MSPELADHGGVYPEPQSALEGSERTHPTCLRLDRRTCVGAPSQNGHHSTSLWIHEVVPPNGLWQRLHGLYNANNEHELVVSTP